LASVERKQALADWERAPDGSWRFFREIWNSSLPAAPPVNK